MIKTLRMDIDARPYVRWWWFSNWMNKRDIERQIQWIAEMGFGGTEIAFVYPLPNREIGVPFLSPEWTELCVHARRCCDREGLGCDFTFGTLWPFGGSFIPEKYASKCWNSPSPQRLDRSWELSHEKEPGRILDHLSADAFHFYASRVGTALEPALYSSDWLDCLFCDSWEVETEGLWTEGFGERFRECFGYDILPFMSHLDQAPCQRYDYRILLADFVMEGFYLPFEAYCRSRERASRVQCHGAPVDLIRAYAEADVPETEAVLFDPEFASFAASAALWSNHRTVSSESFSCLYGWNPYPGPAPYEDQEQLGDLKLTADALFASGVNHIVWHGMPFQGEGERNRFYASVHVGPDSLLASSLKSFNGYLEKVSSIMKRGRTYARLACLYPYEDSLMAGEVPAARRKPSSKYFWEMQEYRRPKETLLYGSVWIDTWFLSRCRVEGGKLRMGEVIFDALYVDVEYLERDTLAILADLASLGAPVCLKRSPSQPGTAVVGDYSLLLDRLQGAVRCCTVLEDLGLSPLVQCESELPPFWVRRDGEDYYYFFAHPRAAAVSYPLPYGFYKEAKAVSLSVILNPDGCPVYLDLDFQGPESLLYHIHGGEVEKIPLPSIQEALACDVLREKM